MSASLFISLRKGTAGRARLVYLVLLLGLLLPGLNVIGVLLAYLDGEDSDPVLASHRRNQIHIFWKSVIYVLVGIALTYVLVGVLVLMAAFVWYILRILRGLKALGAGSPAANPASWLF